MRLKTLLLLCILFVYCSIDPVVQDADTVGDYFAYCTLSPELEKQIVLVGRTVPESLPYWYDNVVITLSGCGQSSQFRYLSNGRYEEIPPCVPLKGDSLYSLNVLFPGGHRITATTRMPGDFAIIDPAPGDTLYYQLGPRSNPKYHQVLPAVEWLPSSGAYYYCSGTKVLTGPIGAGIAYSSYSKISIPFYPYAGWVIGEEQLTDYLTNVSMWVDAYDSSAGFHKQDRDWLGPDALPDYDPALAQLQEDWIRQQYIDLQGGFGFFNAINRTESNFWIHVKVVEPDSGEVNQ